MPPTRLPPHFSIENHRQRCLAQLRSKETGLERYIYLSGLKDREPDLFYELVLTHMMVRSCAHFLQTNVNMLDVRRKWSPYCTRESSACRSLICTHS